MVRRKKSRTKKRRMPQHIVLPNGMWRFVKSGAKSKRIKIKRKTKKRGVSFMAKRRRSSRRYSRGLSSGRGIINNGIYKPSGIIEKALLGMGASTLQEKIAPQVIPYQSEIVGFAVGGWAGALGSFARTFLKVGNISGSGANLYNSAYN